VQIYATNISAANFLSSGTTSSNVHLSTASSTSFSLDWSNKFSFVHQRLLYGGLRASEWPVALSEIFRISEPGDATQSSSGWCPEAHSRADTEETDQRSVHRHVDTDGVEMNWSPDGKHNPGGPLQSASVIRKACNYT